MAHKIIFLDRDGVINKYPGDGQYVTTLSGFKLIPGSARAIKMLCSAGFKVFVVSNQAGVTKGLYSKQALNKMTAYMLDKVRKAGGRINKVLYCVHTNQQNCSCRKP